MMKKIALLAFFLALFGNTPIAYAASTHTYICTDFSTVQPPATCVSGTITLHNSASEFVVDATPTFQIGIGTRFISFTTVRTSGQGCLAVNGQACFLAFTVSQTAFSFSSTGNGGLYIDSTGSGGTGYTGTIGAICVTDTSGACEGGGAATTPIGIIGLVRAFWLW